jgi:hypothetical protein
VSPERCASSGTVSTKAGPIAPIINAAFMLTANAVQQPDRFVGSLLRQADAAFQPHWVSQVCSGSCRGHKIMTSSNLD